MYPSTGLSSNWAFFKKILASVYGDEPGTTEREDTWPKYLDEKTADDLYFDVQEFVGIGNYEKKAPGAPMAIGFFGQGQATRVIMETFAKRIAIPEEVVRFTKYRKQTCDGVKELKRSAKRSMEYLGANLLNNSFSATVLGVDGKALCASDHPIKGGGTYSNAPTALTFCNTALRTYITACRKMPGTNGLIAGVLPKTVIGPSEHEWRFQEVLKSPLKDDTANHTYNVMKGSVDWVCVPWLSTTTAWWLKTDAPDGLTRWIADKPEFRQQSIDTALVKEFDGFFRLADACPNGRGVLGANL